MRVLIAGCGYVGCELGDRLARTDGHEVWGLRRDPSGVPSSVRPLAADLLDPELGRRLPTVDRVVFAASADASAPEEYRAAYVEAVRNLLTALAERPDPPDRIVYVSSTAVCGDASGGWVDEETPPAPQSFRGEIVLEGEQLVRAGAIPAVVMRLGGIYGPGRTRLVERVRSGQAQCPDDGPFWSNRIHRDDAAGALRHLLELEEPAEVYLGVDDAPAPICDVYRWVADLLGAPEPRVDPGARPRRSNKRCSNRRLRESGYRFEFPSFREGYGAMLATEE